jgi:C-terminal processing protease CtpA/Prc
MLFMTNEASNDAVDNFESMWKQLDEKYSFFEYKNIDWDSVYNVYKPMVLSDMDEQDLFDILSKMMNALYDGHSNIFAPFDYSRNWSWFLDYPPNFDQNILERNYLGNDYSVTGPFKHKRLEGNIGYIYYSSFSGSLITQEQWDYLVREYVNTNAIIFDIRNNGGGYMANVQFIASQLINETCTYGYYKVKNGPEHDSFSDRIDLTVTPANKNKDHEGWQRPLANKDFYLLTNRHCYSAANFFATFMKQRPNTVIIGDNTGGGGGLPMDYQLPNGWNYRFSSTITYTNDGFNIEHGIEPDIKMDMSQEDIAQGKDSFIEKALSIIGD